MRDDIIWKEKNPIRGKIRRSFRAARQWLAGEAMPALLVLAITGHCILLTLITIGERTSGPVASLSPSQHNSSVLSFTGYDPRASVTASRADHGHSVAWECK